MEHNCIRRGNGGGGVTLKQRHYELEKKLMTLSQCNFFTNAHIVDDYSMIA